MRSEIGSFEEELMRKPKSECHFQTNKYKYPQGKNPGIGVILCAGHAARQLRFLLGKCSEDFFWRSKGWHT
jgi:hypothetical protein